MAALNERAQRSSSQNAMQTSPAGPQPRGGAAAQQLSLTSDFWKQQQGEEDLRHTGLHEARPSYSFPTRSACASLSNPSHPPPPPPPSRPKTHLYAHANAFPFRPNICRTTDPLCFHHFATVTSQRSCPYHCPQERLCSCQRI